MRCLLMRQSQLGRGCSSDLISLDFEPILPPRKLKNHQVEQTHPCTIHLSGICGQGGLDSHGFPDTSDKSTLAGAQSYAGTDCRCYQLPDASLADQLVPAFCNVERTWENYFEDLWRGFQDLQQLYTILYNIKQSYHAQEHSLCILLPCQRLNQIGIGNRFLVFYCQEERDDEDLEASCQL